MPRHTLSMAERIFAGNAYHEGYESGKRGLQLMHSYFQSFGAVATADQEAIVKDATSTELPNNATKTYLPSQTGSPLDGSGLLGTTTIQIAGVDTLLWVVPTPRNFVAVATHGSSVVAMTVVITGYDKYLRPLTETLSITATGTSKTATGKKAFAYVVSVAITSASDATANTLDVGTGVLLGFDVRVDRAEYVFLNMDGALQTTVTIATADATAASGTTGDVRGTISFNSAPNGTRRYSALIYVPDTSDRALVWGVDQA